MTATTSAIGANVSKVFDLTVHERLVAVLAALPPIGKDSTNSQQGYKFRGIDTILTHLRPLLAEHGVYVVPNVLERHTDTRTTGNGGTMYEVNLLVSFTFTGKGGDTVTATAWGEGTDMGDKATNKAMTGAFKNVLLQVFAIAGGSEDADESTPEQSTRRPNNVASDKQIGYMKALLATAGLTKENRGEYVAGIIGRTPSTFGDVTSAEAKKIIDQLKAETENPGNE